MRRGGFGWKGRLAVRAAATALALVGSVGTSLQANALSPAADLAITKSAPALNSRAPNLPYPLATANEGPTHAQSVRRSDDSPPSTTFVPLAQTGGPAFGCSTPPVGGTATVGCSIATFGWNATARFTLVVKVSEDA